MEETRTIANPARNDEISLVDILAVLLRWRWLILGITLASMLIAGLLVIWLPNRAQRLSVEDQTYEAVVSARISNSVLVFAKAELVEDILQQTLNDPTTILAALRIAGIEQLDSVNLANQNDDQLLYAIRRRFVENKSLTGSALHDEQRVFFTEKAKGGFTVSITYKDSDAAKNFLLGIIAETNKRMSVLLNSTAQAEVYNFEKIMTIDYPREVIEQNLLQTFNQYSAASRFLAGAEQTLSLIQDPYVLIPAFDLETVRKNILKKAIIGVAAAFFMAVFLAVVLQWIAAIKADPAARQKLRAALGKPVV